MARDLVKEIRTATRRKSSAEEKIRIVMEGLRGEIPVCEPARREGIAPTVYLSLPKTSDAPACAAGYGGQAQRPRSASEPLSSEEQRPHGYSSCALAGGGRSASIRRILVSFRAAVGSYD